MKTAAPIIASALLLLAGSAWATGRSAKALTPIALPGVGKHAGFDDMGFAPALGRIVIPGGISGQVFFIDPSTDAVSDSIRVLPPSKPRRGHDVGTTSAVYVDGFLIASDHNAQSLAVIDLTQDKVVAHVPLASGPDYVRYVKPDHEIWVTEPGAHQIQMFRTQLNGPQPGLHPVGTINVKGGPEALVVDARTGDAYTNLWKKYTLAINLKSHKIVSRWVDGCRGPRGLALAPKHHLLFVGCTEGKADALALDRNGLVVAQAKTGKGVDIIAWNPRLQHLYVPAARSGTLTVLALTAKGLLLHKAVLKAARGSHCVATDGNHQAYVCDPLHGRILVYHDTR